jgi:hypothetical protein
MSTVDYEAWVQQLCGIVDGIESSEAFGKGLWRWYQHWFHDIIIFFCWCLMLLLYLLLLMLCWLLSGRAEW